MNQQNIKEKIVKAIDSFLINNWNGQSFSNIFLNKMVNYIIGECNDIFDFSDSKPYFTIILKDKVIYNFNFKCNKIQYSDKNYLLCFNSNKDRDELLAIFPHSEVLSVQKEGFYET